VQITRSKLSKILFKVCESAEIRDIKCRTKITEHKIISETANI